VILSWLYLYFWACWFRLSRNPGQPGVPDSGESQGSKKSKSRAKLMKTKRWLPLGATNKFQTGYFIPSLLSSAQPPSALLAFSPLTMSKWSHVVNVSFTWCRPYWFAPTHKKVYGRSAWLDTSISHIWWGLRGLAVFPKKCPGGPAVLYCICNFCKCQSSTRPMAMVFRSFTLVHMLTICRSKFLI